MKKLLLLISILMLNLSVFGGGGPPCVSTYLSTADAFCNSPVITQNGPCVAGTNVGLTACLSGGCAGALSQDFMQFTATTTSVTINFTSTGINTADVALITNSAAGCGLGSDASVCPIIGSLCIESCNTSVGVGPLSITASGLTIGVTYYLMIESSAVNSGTFNICVITNPCFNGIQDGTETGVDCGGICAPCAGPANCLDNDACTAAAPLVINASGGVPVCVNDCNTGSNPGPDFAGNNCYDLPNGTVWYSITTDVSASTIDIILTSGTMSATPEFTVFTNVCGPYTIINCTEGSGGVATATGIAVNPSTTYLIAVSNVSGSAGTFNLCVAQDPDNSACNTTNIFSMTSSTLGSPQGGPYIQGDVVEFCYTLTNWQMINCNYIGAFVPSFGNCWDPASFNAQGMPINITTPLAVNGVIQTCPPGPPCPYAACAGTPSGSWNWFPSGAATYNVNGYYPIGTPMPAGWYFLSSYNPLTGSCNGGDPVDPDFTYGDGNFPACGTNTFDYTICFTLTAGNDSTKTDCFVGLKTFADGEFGAWNNIGCTVDALSNIPGVLPITLKSFTGYNEDKTNYLEWVTSSEINNNYFTLERSVDTEVWEQIYVINGAGNSSQELKYKYSDNSYINGINYYKLTQTDFNGGSETFPIITIVTKVNKPTKWDYVINLLGQIVGDDYTGFRFLVWKEDFRVLPLNPGSKNPEYK